MCWLNGRRASPARPPGGAGVDPANTGLGHRQVQRWNLPEGWVISKRPAHPALVSEAEIGRASCRERVLYTV